MKVELHHGLNALFLGPRWNVIVTPSGATTVMRDFTPRSARLLKCPNSRSRPGCFTQARRAIQGVVDDRRRSNCCSGKSGFTCGSFSPSLQASSPWQSSWASSWLLFWRHWISCSFLLDGSPSLQWPAHGAIIQILKRAIANLHPAQGNNRQSLDIRLKPAPCADGARTALTGIARGRAPAEVLINAPYGVRIEAARGELDICRVKNLLRLCRLLGLRGGFPRLGGIELRGPVVRAEGRSRKARAVVKIAHGIVLPRIARGDWMRHLG